MSNVGQKVNQMKDDLAKIVTICNAAEDWRLASVSQSCLQQIGQLSTQLGQPENEIAKKSVPGTG